MARQPRIEYAAAAFHVMARGNQGRQFSLTTGTARDGLRRWGRRLSGQGGGFTPMGMKSGRDALNEQWKGIRRGWYLGGDAFRARMLKQVKETLGKNRLATYSGEAKRIRGELEARRQLALGLAELEVGDRQLQEGAKGMPEKEALAWWIGQPATVSRRWVKERLWMGDESRVCHAIRRV